MWYVFKKKNTINNERQTNMKYKSVRWKIKIVKIKSILIKFWFWFRKRQKELFV